MYIVAHTIIGMRFHYLCHISLVEKQVTGPNHTQEEEITQVWTRNVEELEDHIWFACYKCRLSGSPWTKDWLNQNFWGRLRNLHCSNSLDEQHIRVRETEGAEGCGIARNPTEQWGHLPSSCQCCWGSSKPVLVLTGGRMVTGPWSTGTRQPAQHLRGGNVLPSQLIYTQWAQCTVTILKRGLSQNVVSEFRAPQHLKSCT